MNEPDAAENWIHETREDDADDDADPESVVSDTPFHTASDNDRLRQVGFGTVMDLKREVNKLDSCNDAVTKELGPQSSVIFELRSIVQQLTQELKRKPPPTTTPTYPPVKRQQQETSPQHPRTKEKQKRLQIWPRSNAHQPARASPK